MTKMKTPGVYVVEKNAFPNSVVQVATAVPAFIGYTQTAKNGDKTLRDVPCRISSLSEFHQYFGHAPSPKFNIVKSGNSSSSQPSPLIDGDQADSLLLGFSLTNPEGTEESYSIIQDGNAYALYGAIRLFFQNGGGDCYIVSVGSYKDDIDGDKMIKGIECLLKEPEPTMLVIPETTRLTRSKAVAVQQAMLMHCGEKMKNRFAILDIFSGYKDTNDPGGDPVATFRNDIGINNLDYGSAYYPWVNSSIFQSHDFSYKNLTDEGIKTLKTLLLRTVEDPLLKKQIEDETAFADSEFLTIAAAEAAAEAVQAAAERVKASGPVDSKEAAPTSENLDKTLSAIFPLYKNIMDEIATRMNCMPPASAMAGVYSSVDSSRGVWKAPANISLNSVTSPLVNISHDQQEYLNVTPQGKSINAIRTFVGEGVLVWGARTLDGNSLDCRYINVRRTMIMLEESIRLASKAYVFEPNTASTWVTVKSMIENFLTDIWKRGGLSGAVPEDAFSVHVGLGDTMTPVDILDGIMRITVMVAIIRPAEFMEITFQQHMQKS